MPDGTEAVNEFAFSPDGSTYVGRNAKDLDIRGWNNNGSRALAHNQSRLSQ
ncbi:hypothetical protein LBMAG56_51770 [Verrucomicrobiota bacterium]|nr:hypothetical protein LBMAG56_51770 [Verrucomicrobiota bacterium]